MDNNQYWADRQVQTYLKGEQKVNTYFAKLEKQFLRARQNIQKEINDFYVRYAGENGLSYADAQKELSKQQMTSLHDFVDLVNQHIGEHNTDVENLSIKSRVTRLEEIQKRIDGHLTELYAIDYQEQGENMMRDVYEDAYYRTWYNTDQFHGVHSTFNGVNPAAVDKLIAYPFNGANFSDRLWKQKAYLGQQLDEALTLMLVQGKNPNELADDFAKKMKTARVDAYRLLHTESSYIISQASHDLYKQDGVEQYIIIATLDNKTCPVCGAKDGKTVNMNEATVGDTMPPFHPFCRCTDGPYYGDEQFEDEDRIARDKDGQKYSVNSNDSFKKWALEHPNDVDANTYESLFSEKPIYSDTANAAESELGTFKKRIISDDNISKEYYSELKEKFSHGSDDAKRVFNKYVPNGAVIDSEYTDVPKYENGHIKMNYAIDIDNPRGKCVTYFHEHGHLIDDFAGGISNNDIFYETLQSDFLALTLKEAYTDIENEIIDMRKHSAVSDLLHGLSGEEINGVATHPKRSDGSSYWTKQTICQEAFAHMYEAQFDNVRYKQMKRYFPRGLAEFEKLIKRM